MKIVFASSVCSKNMYKKVFELRNKKLIDPMQKFLDQLISGIADNKKIKVTCISGIPVSASSVSKRLFKKQEERLNNITYIYTGFINGKILRYITSFITCFVNAFFVFRKSKKNKEQVVLICDPLVFHISKAARVAAKLCNIKKIAIITDIPIWATEMKQYSYSLLRKKLQRLYESFAMKEIKRYDGFINLTESMSSIVNPLKKPEIILEGSVNFFEEQFEKNKIKKGKRIILYAGGVYEKYGIKNLVEAFIKAKINNTELHIYGEGEYVEKLKKVCSAHKNIRYCGCKLNSEMRKYESEATLLVNPRFSKEEYTKYSFPSKTLEYMSSGTPVLTTKLKGIPKDYDKYLFWFDDESIEGMSEKLKQILQLSAEELDRFGKCAKDYVMKNKNNIIQGKRIIEFSEKLKDV